MTRQTNKEHLVPVEEILTWYPGDFIWKCGKCPEDRYFHDCISIHAQWEYILEENRADDRYFDIFKSVKRQGFVGRLYAKISEDDHVILLDGHNRVGVALDMSLRELPVYLGGPAAEPDELKAPDSGLWQKGKKPWTELQESNENTKKTASPKRQSKPRTRTA